MLLTKLSRRYGSDFYTNILRHLNWLPYSYQSDVVFGQLHTSNAFFFDVRLRFRISIRLYVTAFFI